MIKILNEMTLSRSDAIDLCIGIGKKFAEHDLNLFRGVV